MMSSKLRPGEKFSIDDTMSETLNTMKDGNARMIKTGYKEIDNLAGGLTRGEITIVGGRPGHGKTTLLRCISGIVPIDDGRIVFDGKQIK